MGGTAHCLSTFLPSFHLSSLEMIGFKRHFSKYGDMYADWDTVNQWSSTNFGKHYVLRVHCCITSIWLTWLESLLSFREQLLALWRPMTWLQKLEVSNERKGKIVAQTFPVFTIKALQWLRRWVLLPKCPDWHQVKSIAPMLRPKYLGSVFRETWQFLYFIVSSCVS